MVRPLYIKMHPAAVATATEIIREHYPAEMPAHPQDEWLRTLARDAAFAVVIGEEFSFGLSKSEEPFTTIANGLVRDLQTEMCGNDSTDVEAAAV